MVLEQIAGVAVNLLLAWLEAFDPWRHLANKTKLTVNVLRSSKSKLG